MLRATDVCAAFASKFKDMPLNIAVAVLEQLPYSSYYDYSDKLNVLTQVVFRDESDEEKNRRVVGAINERDERLLARAGACRGEIY